MDTPCFRMVPLYLRKSTFTLHHANGHTLQVRGRDLSSETHVSRALQREESTGTSLGAEALTLSHCQPLDDTDGAIVDPSE